MGENTKIEWCDHTFNPWMGCQKVSDACKFCYAETETPVRVLRGRGVELWGPSATRVKTSVQTWQKPRQWDAKARREGVRRKVFCASLADVFEDREELNVLRSWLFQLIQETPNLDWLLLTKRPENVMRCVQAVCDLIGPAREMASSWLNGFPKKNIWIGTTVENQEMADRRIPELLNVPAAVRFLSCEPLLGAVNVSQHLRCQSCLDPSVCWCTDARVNWVIAGGESGPNARPMHPDWARSLRDQCKEAGVPFLFKQWGDWKPISEMLESEYEQLYKPNRIAEEHEDQSALNDVFGRSCIVPQVPINYIGETGIEKGFWVHEGHSGMLMFKLGKKKAGRMLDGAEWSQFPELNGGEDLSLSRAV